MYEKYYVMDKNTGKYLAFDSENQSHYFTDFIDKNVTEYARKDVASQALKHFRDVKVVKK